MSEAIHLQVYCILFSTHNLAAIVFSIFLILWIVINLSLNVSISVLFPAHQIFTALLRFIKMFTFSQTIYW